MQTNGSLDLNMSVSDLLAQWPEVIPVFIRHHMACVGCGMSSFETLGDAARIYGVNPSAFLEEVQQAIHTFSKPS